MKFTTPVPIISRDPKIDHNSRIFLTGSCFVENIGDKLDYFKLQNTRNPFGILYHPFAIELLVQNALEKYIYDEDDVFYLNERWHCFAAHSSLSHAVKEVLLENLNEGLRITREQIKNATQIVITPGTAWVYREVETKRAVANCHKLPQKNFTRELSSTEQIQNSLTNLVSHIHNINSDAAVIFTVSPVRHLKDGVVENQRSKAHLIAAVHEVVALAPAKISYFPSYEIMMDELRDYRFYAEDMLHPNKVAVEYIWQIFVDSWFSKEAPGTLADIDKIQKGLAHRPFNEDSTSHKEFLIQLELMIRNIAKKHPHIKFG